MAIIIFFFFFLKICSWYFHPTSHLLYTMYSGSGQINCVAIIWPCIFLGHWTYLFFLLLPHVFPVSLSWYLFWYLPVQYLCFPVEWVQAKQSTNSWIRWNGWICMEWIFILCWCVLALTWKFIMMYQNFPLIWYTTNIL